MIKVTVEKFSNLSDEEKFNAQNGGAGKEWASYIRVQHNGRTLLLKSDAIEPEDKNFHRDLSWIVQAIELAYKLGLSDSAPNINPE